MAQTRTLQRRIRSVKNAKQITKALEVVAASRMRRVVELVDGSRTYGELAAQIMQRIAGSPEAKTHPYFTGNSDKPTLYVIITSDRGQAGAFNSNIFHLSLQAIGEERIPPKVVVYGRKGARFFARLKGIELVGAYEDLADAPEANVFAPLMQLIEAGMNSGEIGGVTVVYTQFVSSLIQKASSFQLLPVTADATVSAGTSSTPEVQRVYEFEPEVSDVLDEAINLYIEARVMQAKIESAASEHAMRMVAMGNANRNASDLIDNLTLELNATRQAAITQEIAEITGGAAAIAA